MTSPTSPDRAEARVLFPDLSPNDPIRLPRQVLSEQAASEFSGGFRTAHIPRPHLRRTELELPGWDLRAALSPGAPDAFGLQPAWGHLAGRAGLTGSGPWWRVHGRSGRRLLPPTPLHAPELTSPARPSSSPLPNTRQTFSGCPGQGQRTRTFSLFPLDAQAAALAQVAEAALSTVLRRDPSGLGTLTSHSSPACSERPCQDGSRPVLTVVGAGGLPSSTGSL